MSKEYSESFIGSVKTLRREAEEKLKENRYYVAIQKLDEILETERMFSRDQQAEQAASGADLTAPQPVSAGTAPAAGATAASVEAVTGGSPATAAELTGAAAMATIAGTGAAYAQQVTVTAPEPAVLETAPESTLFESTAPDAGEIAQSAAVEALSDGDPAVETAAAMPEKSSGSRSRIIPHWWRGQGGGATTDRSDTAGPTEIDDTADQTDHSEDGDSSWIAKGAAAAATGAAGVAAAQARSSPAIEQAETAGVQLREGRVEDVVEVSGTGQVHETFEPAPITGAAETHVEESIETIPDDTPVDTSLGEDQVEAGFDMAGPAIVSPGVHIPDPVEPRVLAEAVAPDSFVASEPVPEAIVSEIPAVTADTTLAEGEGAEDSGGLVTETDVTATGVAATVAGAAAAGMAAIHSGPAETAPDAVGEIVESTASIPEPTPVSSERGRVEVIEAAPTAAYETRTPDAAEETFELVAQDETPDAATVAVAPESSAVETAKSDWEDAVTLAAKPESAILHASGETAEAAADLDVATEDSTIAVVEETGSETETAALDIVEENIPDVAHDAAVSIAEPPTAETIVAETISTSMETEAAALETDVPAATETVTESVPDTAETVMESVTLAGEGAGTDVDVTATATAAATTVTAAAGTATVAGRAFGAPTADVRIERQEDTENNGVVDAVFDEQSPTAAVGADSSPADREKFLRRAGDDAGLGTAPKKGFLRRLISGLTRDD